MKSNLPYQLSDGFLRAVLISLLVVFVNFTVVVPCLSITGLNMNLTEMVEEEIEEQEQHQISLHELMEGSFYLEDHAPTKDKSVELALVHHFEVLTPPPEKA